MLQREATTVRRQSMSPSASVSVDHHHHQQQCSNSGSSSRWRNGYACSQRAALAEMCRCRVVKCVAVFYLCWTVMRLKEISSLNPLKQNVNSDSKCCREICHLTSGIDISFAPNSIQLPYTNKRTYIVTMDLSETNKSPTSLRRF